MWQRELIVRLQGSTWDEIEVRGEKLDEGIVAVVEVREPDTGGTAVEAGGDTTEVEAETGILDENADLEVHTDLLGERGQSVLTPGTTGTDNSRHLKHWNRNLKIKWMSWKAATKNELNYDTMFLKNITIFNEQILSKILFFNIRNIQNWHIH